MEKAAATSLGKMLKQLCPFFLISGPTNLDFFAHLHVLYMELR